MLSETAEFIEFVSDPSSLKDFLKTETRWAKENLKLTQINNTAIKGGDKKMRKI